MLVTFPLLIVTAVNAAFQPQAQPAFSDEITKGETYHDCQLPTPSISAERLVINFSASMANA